MEGQRKTVETVNEDGSELKLSVERPSQAVLREANLHYKVMVARLLKEAAEGDDGLLLRSQLDEYLIKLGVWTEAHQREFVTKQLEIRALELVLRKGGIKYSEGRAVALKMRQLRGQMTEMFSRKSEFDNTTIEATAEQHKFHFLMSMCVVFADTGKPYFKGIGDYLSKETEQASSDCARCMAAMVFGFDEDIEEKLQENVFLKEYGAKDNSGRNIDENNRYVDDEGNFVDFDGNRIDEKGDFIVEQEPFLDDDEEEEAGGE